ncbi:penicillin-binding protein 2 [Patescibacteria group bacterium]|nr:penicillin-binding protein 2 [Patescibacteria group bacterium]
MRKVRTISRDNLGFKANKKESGDPRLRFMLGLFFIISIIIIGRLIILMIFQHSFYVALAAGSQEIYKSLFPTRGQIYIQDSRTGEEYPLAMNRDYFIVYVDTRLIKTDEEAKSVAEKLAEIFGYDDEKKFQVYLQLNKRNDPYEPIENKVEEFIVDKLKEANLLGIAFSRSPLRYYPEGNLAVHVVGFLGKNNDGNDIGRYGIEGYWQKELAGNGGFFEGAKSVGGGRIPLAGWNFKPAENGVDILLTIDRTLQYKACKRLLEASEEYGATSASLVILEPATGKIRTMCGVPDFDPNYYNMVESVSTYNNDAIFTPYEPGSIFKPVAMVAALNEDLVTPDTYFYDSGFVDSGCTKPIKNAGEKIYKDQTMSGVLENSINTGMVQVVKFLGKNKFRQYVEDFGFGIKTGIELDSEASGTIDSLSQNKGDEVDCYTATASFGQGLTATPLQIVSAFSAIANGGSLMKPYIVEELRYPSGKIERFYPKEIRKVLNNRSAMILSGMLVNVIDRGQASVARVDGYYIAGKTGTAQIPGPGGYTEETNHSFVGFGPVDDPKFAMIIKFEKPKREYSSTTAAPVFADIAKFILEYYQVPPNR